VSSLLVYWRTPRVFFSPPASTSRRFNPILFPLAIFRPLSGGAVNALIVQNGYSELISAQGVVENSECWYLYQMLQIFCPTECSQIIRKNIKHAKMDAIWMWRIIGLKSLAEPQ
jgi:hypothetical protein